MQNTISEHTTRQTLNQMGSSSRTPQSPDLNPIEHFWDVVEREIHIMDVQLCDAIMSIWTKISKHHVESMPWRIKAVRMAKGGPTRY